MSFWNSFSTFLNSWWNPATQGIPTERKPVEEKTPKFKISDEYLIPVESGQAVSKGWTSYGDYKPWGVTWHWTATWDLEYATRLLGGSNPLRKGIASAHYGIGRTYSEGVHRWVTLENRSWHAGADQDLRWDGKPAKYNGEWWSGARSTIGVETVNIGYARDKVPAQDNWIFCVHPNGEQKMLVPPWEGEQFEMMVAIGKEIIARWPHIKPEDHHGHHDICPRRKSDVCGFPFAELLRAIYDDPTIPDVWSGLWTIEERQQALKALGYDIGSFGENQDGIDGSWGEKCDAALRDFQEKHNMVVNGFWTSFVNWEVYRTLENKKV